MNDKALMEQIIDTINAIFTARDIVNVDISNMDTEQTEIVMDSITFISIIVALEEEFDIEIPDEYLLLTEMNTISKMTDVISAVLDNQNNSIGE